MWILNPPKYTEIIMMKAVKKSYLKSMSNIYDGVFLRKKVNPLVPGVH